MQQLDFHHTLIIFWVLPITYHAQAHTQQNIVLTIGLLRKKKVLCQFSGACTRGGIGCASGRPICQQALLPGILTKQAESSSHT